MDLITECPHEISSFLFLTLLDTKNLAVARYDIFSSLIAVTIILQILISFWLGTILLSTFL